MLETGRNAVMLMMIRARSKTERGHCRTKAVRSSSHCVCVCVCGAGVAPGVPTGGVSHLDCHVMPDQDEDSKLLTEVCKRQYWRVETSNVGNPLKEHRS